MKEVYEAFMLGGQEIERLRKESKKLKEELQRKDNIIDEAIEYIENHSIFEKDYSYFEKAIPTELIDILRGEDNEL